MHTRRIGPFMLSSQRSFTTLSAREHTWSSQSCGTIPKLVHSFMHKHNDWFVDLCVDLDPESKQRTFPFKERYNFALCPLCTGLQAEPGVQGQRATGADDAGANPRHGAGCERQRAGVRSAGLQRQDPRGKRHRRVHRAGEEDQETPLKSSKWKIRQVFCADLYKCSGSPCISNRRNHSKFE